MNIIIAILIFSIIIIIHELGHFLLAKKNGIAVTEFSVGMGPRVFSVAKGETRYSIKLFPFGGSCMMLGEDETVEDDRAFNRKPVWGRISVIAAGPIFNFILAFLLAMFVIGSVGYDPATVTMVEKGLPADAAGLQPGDVIKKIGGSRIDVGREVANYFQFNTITEKELDVVYTRDGQKQSTTLYPQFVKTYQLGFNYSPSEAEATIGGIAEDRPLGQAGMQVGDVITNINGTEIKTGIELQSYLIENRLTEEPLTITYRRDDAANTVTVTPAFIKEAYELGFSANQYREKTSVGGVLKYSVVEVKYWIVTTVKSLGQMIQGKVSKDDIAGPVGIVSMIGDTYESSKPAGILSVLVSLSYISILLSANLGVMNLLPIPALDGGRLVFLLLEVIRGKPIDQEKEGMVHAIGLIALMLLMVFILFNDISRLF